MQKIFQQLDKMSEKILGHVPSTHSFQGLNWDPMRSSGKIRPLNPSENPSPSSLEHQACQLQQEAQESA